MQESEFREFCRQRKMDAHAVERSVEDVRSLEGSLKTKGRSLETCTPEDIQTYIDRLITEGANTADRLVALARYFYCTGRHDIYIYFTAILGGVGVIENIRKRIATLAGEDAKERIFEGLPMPPLGSPPDTCPPFTRELMKRMEEVLEPETCRRALAGNNHEVSTAKFEQEKEHFKQAANLDAYLKGLHRRSVEELEQFCREGSVWYEQKITPRVVELVRGNQEMLAGVREDDIIYLTKIPYDPDAYVQETDPQKKRYLACHCPFTRAALVTSDAGISPTWCYCSGGFEKLLFDVIFEEPVRVEVLETPLNGDDRCRFAIHIPPGKAR